MAELVVIGYPDERGEVLTTALADVAEAALQRILEGDRFAVG